VTIFILLALMLVAFYLMSMRSRKQQKQTASFRDTLAVGQEVMTTGGLLGTVVDVEGDAITIESTPGNTSRWVRQAIREPLPRPVVVDEVEDQDEDEAVAEIEDANDDVIDVPDDLSSLDEPNSASDPKRPDQDDTK
jgi:preprotein translocase subunit YajC